MWEFAHTGRVGIEDPFPDLFLQRTNDLHLTENFVKEGTTGKLLKHLNQCHIFLRATTLANIIMGDSLQITEKVWKGR